MNTPQAWSPTRRVAAVLVALMCLAATQAHGGVFTLVDGNTSAGFNTNSQTGQFSWVVNGVNRLQQQWSWYRIGGSGPEASLDTLTITNEGTADVDFDGDPDTLLVKLSGTGFDLELSYLLLGSAGTNGVSDIAEQLTITNTSATPLDFHFFQFTDFDLTGSDTAEALGGNTFRQTGGLAVAETVFTPTPSHFETGTRQSLINSLNDGLATTWSGATPAGPGNVAWATQWDAQINPGDSYLIGKATAFAVVPEPSTLSVSVLALLGYLTLSRPRTRRRGRCTA